MTKNNTIIAVDCMGGDHAPHSIIEGISLTINQNTNDLQFLLYGTKSKIDPLLKQYQNVIKYSTVINTSSIISSHDKPSMALRKRKGSSMHAAIDAVEQKHASCAISAGNTGALMAISRLELGTLPNIDRPAIVTAIPAKGHEMSILDLGANIDCDARTLYQFAFMGRAFSKAVFGKNNPSTALLNIGTEEVKGTGAVKGAYSLLTNAEVNFQGYIEADKMFNSKIDVIVTDGFSGNIMLKTAEGMYRLIQNSISKALSSSMVGRLLYVLLRKCLKKELAHLNPKFRNGAILAGLNGIVIKSHGSADGPSFANAIKVAINAVKNNINEQIIDEINKHGN